MKPHSERIERIAPTSDVWIAGSPIGKIALPEFHAGAFFHFEEFHSILRAVAWRIHTSHGLFPR